MQIDIDFEVFKALTLKRDSESHSYNDVLRDLLGLQNADESTTPHPSAISMGKDGRSFGGRFLPNGTHFRATYKQQQYEAHVVRGALVDQAGRRHTSASAAARAVTGNNVNGLTFWQVKRPDDSTWRKLVALPKAVE